MSEINVPSRFWRQAQRLVRNTFPQHQGRGRSRAPLRSTLLGIFYHLRTGCPWHSLPQQFGAASTIYGWWQAFTKAGIWERLWHSFVLACRPYPARRRQRYVLLDASLCKAPCGGTATGPSPVHRGRLGCKRSILTDEDGYPLALVVAPANRHDSRLIHATLAASLRPVAGSMIVADRGYCGRPAQNVCAEAGATLIVPVTRGKSPRRLCGILKRRWPVERCFAWLNQFRAIATPMNASLRTIWVFFTSLQRLFGAGASDHKRTSSYTHIGHLRGAIDL